ncbi:hypothetical protein STA1M1_12450 [Sinisalibacter aestuarii]|uniref:Uncharacterized protein n=1 Tax=Sinisalibacter aestuarii TaxID=2949426 RepID=A0ABQ5LQV9_9RHOB|nr:hypothetical protein STA1M1_12450 [Sinisalibacter aestuarii]
MPESAVAVSRPAVSDRAKMFNDLSFTLIYLSCADWGNASEWGAGVGYADG